MLIKTTLLCIAAILPFNAPAGDELKNACNWLKRMNNSISSLEYEGHFVYQHNNSLEAMHIRHQLTERGPREHLLALNGSAREVIRDDRLITVIENTGGKIQVRQRRASGKVSPIPSIALENLDQFYEFRIGEEVRTAGRVGQVIALKPRDRYRYGYQLTLDLETALPLDVAVLDADGEPVSRIMYTDLQISIPEDNLAYDLAQDIQPVQASASTPVAGQADEVSAVEQVSIANAEHSNWQFSAMPLGFKLKNYHLKQANDEASQLEHFVFSDGLATISVYVESNTASPGLSGHTSLGGVNAVGSQLDEHQLTVVGEVPLAALQLVVGGIKKPE